VALTHITYLGIPYLYGLLDFSITYQNSLPLRGTLAVYESVYFVLLKLQAIAHIPMQCWKQRKSLPFKTKLQFKILCLKFQEALYIKCCR